MTVLLLELNILLLFPSLVLLLKLNYCKLKCCCEEKKYQNEAQIIRSKYVIQFNYRKKSQTPGFMGVGRQYLTTVARGFSCFECLA